MWQIRNTSDYSDMHIYSFECWIGISMTCYVWTKKWRVSVNIFLKLMGTTECWKKMHVEHGKMRKKKNTKFRFRNRQEIQCFSNNYWEEKNANVFISAIIIDRMHFCTISIWKFSSIFANVAIDVIYFS